MKNFKLSQSNSKALVVWGTNLGNSAGNWRVTKLLAQILKLPFYQFSIAVGLLLSDGWLEFPNRQTYARVKFEQSLSKFQYFWSVYENLSPFCAGYPHLRIRILNGKLFYSLRLQTRSLPCFSKLSNLFIKNGVKVVPDDIYNLLDPVALAHWIQGDGAYHPDGGLYLCTDNYSVQDVVRLMSVLIHRYGLDCSLSKHRSGQYRIYVKKNSVVNLQNLVQQHMDSSMLYKINLGVYNPNP